MADAGVGPLVWGERLTKRYKERGAVWRRRSAVLAVDGVSLALLPGEIYGLVGLSGAGKSTLARMLAALERPDQGAVHFDATRVDNLSGKLLRRSRRHVQVVFQDPAGSLNPRMTIGGIVSEPIVVRNSVPRAQRRARVRDLLASVGLPTDDGFLRRRPRELSGGERQRVAIARALACGPAALILDEPVSALDVSVRGQVLNLLLDLRRRLGLGMILIAHHVAVVASVCDRVGVLLRGRIVEEGPAEDVLRHPRHPHTAELVAAATEMGVQDASESVARASVPPGACRYFGSCPRRQEPCLVEPRLARVSRDHAAACLFPLDV